MTSIITKSSLLLIVTGVVLVLVAGGAFANKPDSAGGVSHKQGKEHGDRGHDGNRQGGVPAFGFDNDDRRIVNEYYGEQLRKGKCPPGLAKKHNGCQPPGQAKKWQKGQSLAKDVKYYELPKELRGRLPVPPPNHRYVQVASDILVIAVGSSMVVDAMEDILR